ncbi:hypothetical protein RJ639_032117 [Escallonia herrerae]|uniref:Transposase n=1 Tax=Escallonia herrerae TaxID=1293975 RepID=A0AA88X0Z5_9ASTE|nr:hypothetical protein RJ639_032117 [Escallonia herrerae]
MSTKDLLELIREYPLPKGWYASLPGLQEPANYGTKFETGIYEEQVKSGYRLALHPFALRFFEHYHMARGQLIPNGWRKLARLTYLVQTSRYKLDATDFIRVFFKIHFVKGVADCPGWYYIHSRQRLLKGGPKLNKEVTRESGKLPQGGFLGVLHKAKGKREEKRPSVELPPAPRIMYVSGSKMLSHFEMVRDQGIHDFLDRNAGEKWLKKRTDDGMEIYEMGFMKAKEMFAERFPDISLDDFVMPAVVSPSGETTMLSEAGDAAASHPPEEDPSGDATEP